MGRNGRGGLSSATSSARDDGLVRRVLVVVARSALALALAVSTSACDAADGAKRPCGHTAAVEGAVLLNLPARGDDEWAHIEFTFDPAAGRLSAQVTDSDARTPVRLRQRTLPLRVDTANSQIAVELSAEPDATSGETVGDTSRFATTDGRLLGLKFFEATVRAVSVKGMDVQGYEMRYDRRGSGEQRPVR